MPDPPCRGDSSCKSLALTPHPSLHCLPYPELRRRPTARLPRMAASAVARAKKPAPIPTTPIPATNANLLRIPRHRNSKYARFANAVRRARPPPRPNGPTVGTSANGFLLSAIAQQRGGVAKPETWGGERSGRPLGGLEGPGESGGSGGVWEARTGGWWGGGWQHNTGGYGKRAGRGVCGNNSARRGQRGRDARGVEAAGQCRVCGAGMGRMARARGAKGVERSSSVPGAAVPAGVERGVGSKRRESSHWIDSEQ